MLRYKILLSMSLQNYFYVNKKIKNAMFLCAICVLLYIMSFPIGNKVLIFSQTHIKMPTVLLFFVLFYFLMHLTFTLHIFINQSDLLIGAYFTKNYLIFGFNIVQAFILFKF